MYISKHKGNYLRVLLQIKELFVVPNVNITQFCEMWPLLQYETNIFDYGLHQTVKR